MTNPPIEGQRRPRAFRLAPERPVDDLAQPLPERSAVPPDEGAAAGSQRDAPRAAPVAIKEQPDAFAREAALMVAQPANEVAIEVAQRRGMMARFFGWSGLFWAATVSLVSLGIGLWVDRLVADLFARLPGLGWLALALAGMALLALVALLIREFRGVVRQRKVAALHKRLADAHAADDRDAARSELKTLSALYAARPETARPRQQIEAFSGEIIDGRDLIDLAERHLMGPLDIEVRREIALAARRVSVVTAISPRAMLDLVFVVAQAIRLVRRIAEIYSGRPGLLGFLRLAKSVGTHLAITGGMAVGDSLVQQVVGHGIAAKLSARLGEGVLNGLLTTRVGLSAMSVCRPMPFSSLKQPALRDVAPFLFGDKDG